MSQSSRYPYVVLFPDDEGVRSGAEFLARDPHQHNFETWIDEGRILVNSLGMECLVEAFPDLKVADIEEDYR